MALSVEGREIFSKEVYFTEGPAGNAIAIEREMAVRVRIGSTLPGPNTERSGQL